jgi:hypothetical protein
VYDARASTPSNAATDVKTNVFVQSTAPRFRNGAAAGQRRGAHNHPLSHHHLCSRSLTFLRVRCRRRRIAERSNGAAMSAAPQPPGGGGGAAGAATPTLAEARAAVAAAANACLDAEFPEGGGASRCAAAVAERGAALDGVARR